MLRLLLTLLIITPLAYGCKSPKSGGSDVREDNLFGFPLGSATEQAAKIRGMLIVGSKMAGKGMNSRALLDEFYKNSKGSPTLFDLKGEEEASTPQWVVENAYEGMEFFGWSAVQYFDQAKQAFDTTDAISKYNDIAGNLNSAVVRVYPTIHRNNGKPVCLSTTLEVSPLPIKSDADKPEVVLPQIFSNGKKGGNAALSTYLYTGDELRLRASDQYHFDYLATIFVGRHVAYEQVSYAPIYKEKDPDLEGYIFDSTPIDCTGSQNCKLREGHPVNNIEDCPSFSVATGH